MIPSCRLQSQQQCCLVQLLFSACVHCDLGSSGTDGSRSLSLPRRCIQIAMLLLREHTGDWKHQWKVARLSQ